MSLRLLYYTFVHLLGLEKTRISKLKPDICVVIYFYKDTVSSALWTVNQRLQGVHQFYDRHFKIVDYIAML